jgi:hypothetical protein
MVLHTYQCQHCCGLWFVSGSTATGRRLAWPCSMLVLCVVSALYLRRASGVLGGSGETRQGPTARTIPNK